MQTLFDASGRKSVVERLDRLTPSSSHQWGKMDVAQMMAHCSAALAVATGDTPRKQALIGRIFGPFVKSSLLGEKPFSRNSPTDPTFVMADQKDFAREKERLTGLIGRFVERGPEHAGAQIHSFLGRLRGDEWGVMMYKHLDHHLKQFGA
ncbi:MAG: DUF1569 domain-containing protein [Acidobacteriota bacterium]